VTVTELRDVVGVAVLVLASAGVAKLHGEDGGDGDELKVKRLDIYKKKLDLMSPSTIAKHD